MVVTEIGDRQGYESELHRTNSGLYIPGCVYSDIGKNIQHIALTQYGSALSGT